MHKKTHRHHGRHTHSSRRFFAMPALLALLTCSVQSSAQWNSMWYTFDEDVKNYAIVNVPNGASNRETVMAGTAFDNNGHGVIHFAHMDNGALPSMNWPGIIHSKIFDDPAYIDERAVDIKATTNPNEFFITALSRQAWNSAPVVQDKIRVMKIQADGTLLDNVLLADNAAIPPGQTWGNNLYPISSFYKDNVNGRNILYICGFVGFDPNFEGGIYAGGTGKPIGAYPDYYTTKSAFVMSLDVTDPVWYVAQVKYFENTIPPGTSTLQWDPDFDIAMRMDWINQGNLAGNLFVTGSMTSMTGTANGVPWSYTHIRSKIMNLVLDPGTLGIQGGGPKHFIETGNGDGFGWNEYGVGIYADNIDGYFMVSNVYRNTSGPNGSVPADWHNTQGFNSDVFGISIAHLDANMDIDVDPNYHDINGWATNIMPHSQPADLTEIGNNVSANGFTGSSRFIIAGMVTRGECSANASNKNIDPFLMDVNVGRANFWPGTVLPPTPPSSAHVEDAIPDPNFNGTYPNLVIFPNNTGTGDPTGGFTNTYANLGQGLSNPFWCGSIATRMSGNDYVVMHAPKWGTANNRLGLKTMFADQSPATSGFGGTDEFVMMESPCPLARCREDDYPVPHIAEPTMQEPSGGIDIIFLGVNQGVDYDSTIHGDCAAYLNGSVYRQATGVQKMVKGKTALYPNPASTEVQLVLDKHIAATADVRVVLVNIYGQQVAGLYHGDAKALQSGKALQLPGLAGGVYFVHITADGKPVYKEKLVVNQ